MPATNQFNHHLLEAFDELWNNLVDPAEPFYDTDGTRWNTVSNSAAPTAAVPFHNEQQLADIRRQCRSLAVSNEFAINGHEARMTKPLSCF